LHVFRKTLSKDHLSIVSHCDSAFTMWNTLVSPKEQASPYDEIEPIVDESD